MQILITVLVAAAAAVQTFSFTGRTTRSDSVLVRSVIDGDTIDVAAVGRVRLLGIDAPEIGRGYDTSAPFGREARDRLSWFCIGGCAWNRKARRSISTVVTSPTCSPKTGCSSTRRSCATVLRGCRRVCRSRVCRSCSGQRPRPRHFAVACGGVLRRFQARVILGG